MADTLYLALVFHNHQPVGQFDRVTEHIANVSYLPLVELLERHPAVKVGMHYSGLLLQWFKEHQPQMIERLRELVARGQIEMISGGYYEPILAALPDEDKIGQIEKLNAELRATFGIDPTGMWLAERVWEPHLARPIAEAGLHYVILDDTHFESVGLDKERDLFGYYITEEQGFPLAVLATLHYLRYAIPWHPVESLIDWLRAERDQGLPSGQPKLAFMGDNGEKFGTWPGTYEHCWGEPKYMESLFGALEDNADWLKTTTPSAFMHEFSPLGRIYLPTASYVEMSQW
ncbi:MAG TPA: 4-alpha-glucanotransferase, partial [Aggregatilineales bacterium]|nr:4-alpha-glucanotransferase [Aggregatilineales bacterium]